ncbi:MAG: 5-(carboxyamino)imidazole ribonucleotide synthase [Saprospiraceae bacterium]|nr:5-(carboxyamino)imidazole ribonucleotide synthase [Saprospiraceae bacterium]
MSDIKIGVLGGGQLGRMLQQEASALDLNISFLDKAKDFPTGLITHNFVVGDFNNYDDVIRFGLDKDIVTIEIEAVNADALSELESKGVKVYPQSRVIKTIKDKGLQKQFYSDNNFPTSKYILAVDKDDIINKIKSGEINYPFVQKARTDGYDGKGVVVIKDSNATAQIMDVPSVIEHLVDIDKEIAIIVARNEYHQITTFPLTEMVFDEKGNLLDYLISPANVIEDVINHATSLAHKLITSFDMVGLLAVELFLTKDGEILINEVAPRTHNSGHHTINANDVSQFQMQLRSICNLTLCPPRPRSKYSAIVNVLGTYDTTVGPPFYEGINEILNQEGIFPHIYGKKIVKPLRKMGHVTILSDDEVDLLEKVNFVKQTLKVYHDNAK